MKFTKRILIIGLTMGLFGFFKKSPEKLSHASPDSPYKDSVTNLIYNLLFCDDLDLYKANTHPTYAYPFDIIFSEASKIADLQKVVDDEKADPRVKILAYNRMLAGKHKPNKQDLLAVIVEVGLEGGLDVLASFNNGTARYINQTGKMLVWERTKDSTASLLTADLFSKSRNIVAQIGPWDKPRLPHPTKGNTRITFLVSDGFYFGEGPTDVLFSDPLASPALTTATQLMQYLTTSQNPIE